MPDFNPNEMDALFREGAERHEFEYNPNAWALMEEKLDNKSRKKRILFFLLGLILLVAAVVSFSYFNTNKQDNNVTEIASSQQETPIIQENKASQDFAKIDDEEISNDANYTKSQPQTKKEYISTDSKESSSNIGAQNSFQSENTGNLIGNEIVSMPSQTKVRNTDQQNQPNVFVQEKDEEILSKKLTELTANVEKVNLSIPSLSNKEFKLFETDEIDFNSADLKPTQTQFTPILLTNSNRFALTVFANPEWSSVGLFKDAKAGWSVGTKFGYQFSNKFEVSAGLAFSRKIYEGAGNEYTMEGGWFKDIEPMQMDAKCDVIEVPLALSYYINGFRNNGFFVDLGINSYMLHSEWYGFDYNDALVRPTIYEEVTEEDENSHLVGVGRFAIGYQKVLSKNTSFQIAPYLQFPLTGIGAGQVNLYSSGVQIAVKFNTQ